MGYDYDDKQVAGTTMIKRWLGLLGLLMLISGAAQAQSGDLAAVLNVRHAGVALKLAGTENWIGITKQAIVSAGDAITTDTTGSAQIVFPNTDITTDLDPGGTYQFDQFAAADGSLQLHLATQAGFATQQIGISLTPGSRARLDMPKLNIFATRFSNFSLRVDQRGRSSVIVHAGRVTAQASTLSVLVSGGYGVRAEVSGKVSDVVRADTFPQLDAAIDGCPAHLTTPDDESLNVRLSPNVDTRMVGVIPAAQITWLYGKAATQPWYRVLYQGGYAWVMSSTATVDPACAGLRLFPDDYGPENGKVFIGDSSP